MLEIVIPLSGIPPYVKVDPAAAFEFGMEPEQVDRISDRSAEARREVSSAEQAWTG